MKNIFKNSYKIVPIWQPRNWNKMVLIATYHFSKDKVFFCFCIDERYKDLYVVETDEIINNCTICSNGKIDCYEIPFEYIKNAGTIPDDFLEQIENERKRYLIWKENQNKKTKKL